jgi:two-component system C4-dicarboxylate transport sensor histidine kinase DctB
MQTKQQAQRLLKSAATATIIIAALIVLLITAWVIELWRAQEFLQTQVEQQTKELDRELAQLSILPRLLSIDPRMAAALTGAAPDVISIANHALATTKTESGVSFAFLMNTDGDTIASSNWNDPVSFVGKNYKFRPYFYGALQGRLSTFFAVGATTGVPGYFIADAVRSDDQVIGVIVVKMELDRLLESWSENGFKSLLVDELGVVILSTEAALLYAPTAAIAPGVRSIIDEDRRYTLNTRSSLQSLQNTIGRNQVWRLSSNSNNNTGNSNGNSTGNSSTLYISVDEKLNSENWTLHNFLPLSAIVKGALPYFAILSSLLAIAYLSIRSYRQRKLIALTRERHAASLEFEVKQRTSELESAQQALIAQSNFAMLGRMSAAINHEINQPLASLRFNLATLRQMIDKPRPANDDLRETIIESDRTTKRIGRVVETLRSVARQGNRDLSQVGIKHLIGEVSNIVRRERPTAVTALSVESNPDAQQTCVWGNEILLQQALLNLLYNALDAVLDTSNATVKLYARLQAENETITIGVVDNGGGIDPSLVEHLFQPFQAEMTHRKGLGLGLTLAKQIVEDHNGVLSYEPAQNGGSHFTVQLPIHSDARSKPVR